MDKAICWELTSTNQSILGVRMFVAGRYTGTQVLVVGNDKPRWSITESPDAENAVANAVATTRAFESTYDCTLAVEPGEVILHRSEHQALAAGGRIPAALRARIYTSLHRRRQS